MRGGVDLLLEHGGALRKAAHQYGIPVADWLDLSTGINPHGWTLPTVPDAVWRRLPEAEDDLLAAASAYYATPHLLAVAGSQAAIQALPTLRPPSTVGVLHPSYAEHAHAWRRAGHRVEALAVAELDQAVERLDVLVIINPNNPTGQRLHRQTLLDWQTRLNARHGWLIIDEAFLDARPADSLSSCIGLPGLIVLRSLGKFFGLAGARAGFVLAEPLVCEQLEDALGPWSVSGPTRWIATHALQDRAWQAQMRDALPHASQRLAALLHRQGLPVAGDSELFQWIPMPDAHSWYQALAEHGILVRYFSEPSGLRFGLPGRENEWQRLELTLAAIRNERLR